VDITNAVRMANYGLDAELRCYHVPVVSVVESGERARTEATEPSMTPLVAQPLAFLQSTTQDQQLLFLSLLDYRKG
jgi:hypothetical protein